MEILTWALGLMNAGLIAVLTAMWKHKDATHNAMWQEIKANTKALADFRVEVAEKYVSAKTMEQFERRIVHALEEVTTSVNNLARELHEHQLETKRG